MELRSVSGQTLAEQEADAMSEAPTRAKLRAQARCARVPQSRTVERQRDYRGPEGLRRIRGGQAPLVTALTAFVTQGCAAGSSTKGAGLIELGSSNCQMPCRWAVVESGA